MNSIESQKGEIVMYQPDETIRLEVKVENETVWLTQQQMAELFLTTKQNISLHVNNIFKEDELEKDSVVKESLTTATDGKKYKTKIYNLDVIISVGYRVKSLNGTKFRRWANSVLKQYLLKGYAVNQRMFDIEQKMVEQNRSQLQLDIQRHNQQYPPYHGQLLPAQPRPFPDHRRCGLHLRSQSERRWQETLRLHQDARNICN